MMPLTRSGHCKGKKFCSLHGGGPFGYTMCLTTWSLVPPLNSTKLTTTLPLFFRGLLPQNREFWVLPMWGPLNSHVYNLMYVHAIETIHVFDICKNYEKFYAFIPKERKVAYIIVYHTIPWKLPSLKVQSFVKENKESVENFRNILILNMTSSKLINYWRGHVLNLSLYYNS